VVGRKIQSTTLFVAADDSRNDAATSTLVVLGAIAQHIWAWQLDGWLGAGMAIFIMISGLKAIKDTVSPLLGEGPPQQLVDELYRRITAYEGVLGVHDLMVHSYGPSRQLATVHVEMDSREDPMKSHGIIDHIERDIEREIGVRLVVHLDPIAVDDAQTARLHDKIQALVTKICPTLSIHDLRMVHTHDHTNVIFDIAVPPGYRGNTTDIVGWISAGIKMMDETYYPVIEMDRNYAAPSEVRENEQ
jgi:divalent metal cation (Fe/Co/Zn/Cd) transporter